MSYWYCVKHHAVESDDGCTAIDRLGPYDTEQAAENALQTAKERNEAWDSDSNWNDS